MPTDTVYVLVAACNRPDAVVKAFKSAHYNLFVLFTRMHAYIACSPLPRCLKITLDVLDPTG